MKSFRLPAAAQRIAWIDIARGLGIILVVYGHILRGLASSHILSKGNPIWASDYTIYTFHMPLFFLLAGLQVERSLSKGRWAFLKSKVMTVAYPYLLWSWFQLSVQMLAPKGLMNTEHSPSALLTVPWHPTQQFWFLYVLFLCHLVAFATKARRWLLMPFLAMGFFVAVLIARGTVSAGQWIGAVVPWLVFFIAGILLSKPLLSWRPGRKAAFGWMLGAALGFAELSHLCRTLSHADADSILSWPATVTGVFLIISMSHLLARATGTLADWMGRLGRASMTVYIFHVLAGDGTRDILKKAHILNWKTHLLVDTLAGIALPFLLHLILERLDLLAALGLGAKRRVPLSQPCPLPASRGLE